MKYAIIALAVSVFILIGCATTPPPKSVPLAERNVRYIIDIPGKDQAELYRLSNEWLAKTFVSSKDVIQYKDKDEGIIVGRGKIWLEHPFGPMDCWTTLTLETKDNKLRMTFEDAFVDFGDGITIKMDDEGKMAWYKQACDRLKADLHTYLISDTEDW